jgi:bacteriorhodopsin
MIDEIIVFQVGAIIFAFSSIVFLLLGKKKVLFDTEFFISFITTMSYVIMSLGVATTISFNGQTIYWSRWLFYIVACPLLMYDIIKILKISNKEYYQFALLTALTMFNGFLASYLSTSSRWIFLLLGSFAFICLLYLVFRGNDNSDFKHLKPFVFIGWSLFPVVFLLSPTGLGLLETTVSESLYLVLDVVTKMLFGIITIRLKTR